MVYSAHVIKQSRGHERKIESTIGVQWGQIESIIGVQWGQKYPNPMAHSSSGKRGLPSFPLNGGPEGWGFLEPLNTNDRFFFSYTTTLRYSTVFICW